MRVETRLILIDAPLGHFIFNITSLMKTNGSYYYYLTHQLKTLITICSKINVYHHEYDVQNSFFSLLQRNTIMQTKRAETELF